MKNWVIDLNADLGEGAGYDKDLIPLLTSANIACGFHAGNPHMMQESIRLCAENGVHVGAHPSFPDVWGFGRREMKCSHAEVVDYVLYQLGAVEAFCRANGVKLHHVKPHGAIYNMAGKDRKLADAIVEAIVKFNPELKLFAQPGVELAIAGREAGLEVVHEVFADRAYNMDGSLVSRKLPKSVLHDPKEVLDRTLKMVCEKEVITYDGQVLALDSGTVCLHGDNPAAIALATSIREGLEKAGVTITAP